MGFEFLLRVRRVTLVVTALAAMAGVVYANWAFGAAILLGSLWSLANLLVLESLTRIILAALLGRAPERRDVLCLLAGGPALFLAGWLLFSTGLAALALTLGFWMPYAVIVLKTLGIAMARALDFATGRSSERPADAVRRPLPSRRAQGIVGWALVLVFGVVLALWASAAQEGGTGSPHPSAGASAEQVGAEKPGGPAEAEKEEGAPETPTITGVIAALFPGQPWAVALARYEDIAFTILAATILVLLVGLAFARPKLIPGRGQALVELIAQGSRDFLVGTFGPAIERYVPFVGTIFFYILCMNWMGLVPLLKSPTASLNTTAAMAIVVFLYVQYTAIRYQGLFGYLHHLAGSPKDVVGWFVAPILFPIEVMGEFIKPLSLAARLFGNIFGEDLLIAVFIGIGAALLAWQPVPIGFPIHVLFMFLGLVMGAVQAMVFALLAAVYLYMALPHHEEEPAGAEHGAQPATA